MRVGKFLGRLHRARLHAGDYIVCGKPDEHQLRREQHAELGGDGGDERFDNAGVLHFKRGQRLDEREPDGDHDLYANGYQFRWLEDIHGHRDGHGESAGQAND